MFVFDNSLFHKLLCCGGISISIFNFVLTALALTVMVFIADYSRIRIKQMDILFFFGFFLRPNFLFRLINKKNPSIFHFSPTLSLYLEL